MDIRGDKIVMSGARDRVEALEHYGDNPSMVRKLKKKATQRHTRAMRRLSKRNSGRR